MKNRHPVNPAPAASASSHSEEPERKAGAHAKNAEAPAQLDTHFSCGRDALCAGRSVDNPGDAGQGGRAATMSVSAVRVNFHVRGRFAQLFRGWMLRHGYTRPSTAAREFFEAALEEMQ